MSVTIISVGNGGYNLATDLIKANIFPDAKLFVCDTDGEQLKKNSEDADQTFLLDKIDSVSSKNRGLVSHIIEESSDIIIVCATLGGMTGTKYAPLIALEAILRGKFVCTLCSLPFTYEGPRKRTRAEKVAMLQFRVVTNLLLCQDNDCLSSLGDNLTLNDINKPIVETLKAQLQSHSLQELSVDSESRMIPSEFENEDQPIMTEYGDCFKGIPNELRIEMFDAYK